MRKHVMVIDDDPLMSRATARTLRKVYEVEVFSTGAEALKALQEKQYHCIVCDVNMGGLSGPQVLDAVRKTHPTMTGHFLFHTASINKEEIRALQAPCLEKPSTTVRLLSVVSSLCA